MRYIILTVLTLCSLAIRAQVNPNGPNKTYVDGGYVLGSGGAADSLGRNGTAGQIVVETDTKAPYSSDSLTWNAGLTVEGPVNFTALPVETPDSALVISSAGSVTKKALWADSLQIAILQHQETDNTSATDITKFDQWDARTINTEVVDQIGVTIVGDTAFTLPAGNYLIDYSTNFYVNNSNSFQIQTRLYDETNTTEVGRGESWVQSLISIFSLSLHGSCFVSIDGDTSYTLQHWLGPTANITSAKEGYRTVSISAGTEVFATVKIIRLK